MVIIKNFYFYKIRVVLFGFLSFTVGIFVHSLHSQKPELPLLKGKETITFKITKKLNSNEKNRRYEIDAWKDKAYFKSVLSFSKTQPELNYQHYYQGEIYVNQIEKPYSDFQFDYGKYLSRKGIYFQSYMPNSLKLAKRDDLSFVEKVKQRRSETLAKIDQTNLKKRSREFAKGIILADRTEMDQEIVTELIQSELNTKNLIKELNLILQGERREEMLSNFTNLRIKLGGKGASDESAALIVNG